MKRLLCIVGCMNAGGAETFLMKLYRNIDRTKYQMDFAVAEERKGFYEDEILSLGGKIHRVSPKTKGFIKNFIEIKSLVKIENYKYVLRVSQHSLSAMELFAAKLGGAQVRAFRSSNSNTGGGKANQIIHMFCRPLPRIFANVWIAPSTEAGVFGFGHSGVKNKKFHMLHNAIQYDEYAYSFENRQTIRNELGLGNAFVVGHVGRFTHQKNHLFLLEIFKQILNTHPSAKLVLVGNGRLENDIRAKIDELGIKDQVVFTGVRRDVPKLMAAMDVFVLPSFFEGMPNTVIEAQACGLPCVIADTITREANITGLVRYLPLQNVDEWASTVVTVAMDDNRQNMKEAFCKAGYEIQEVTKRFAKIIFYNDEKF